jgi:general secretion pathway protein K
MRNKQSGAAIIVALFITSLVAAISIAMIAHLRMDIRRTELLLNTTRAEFYAQGSIFWAIDQLNNNWQTQKPNTLIDITPLQSPTNKIDNLTINTTIYDAQARFNLNNLSNNEQRNNFIRLLRLIEPKIDGDAAKKISSAILDWIGPSNSNATTEFYAKKSYRAPHRLMASVSELRLVRGMTPELFAKLAPFVCVLPEKTKININHAPLPILMSLLPTLTIDGAKALSAYRVKTPFTTPQAFLNFELVKNNTSADSKLNDNITVVSSYFLVITNVKVAQQTITLYTLVQRILKDNKPMELILWQTKGTL